MVALMTLILTGVTNNFLLTQNLAIKVKHMTILKFVLSCVTTMRLQVAIQWFEIQMYHSIRLAQIFHAMNTFRMSPKFL